MKFAMVQVDGPSSGQRILAIERDADDSGGTCGFEIRVQVSSKVTFLSTRLLSFLWMYTPARRTS